MTINGKRMIFAQLAAVAAFALTLTGSLQAQVDTLYADSTVAQSTSSQSLVPITGLTFALPAASTSHKFAMVTLDMPNLYLSGTPANSTLGAQVGVLIDGTTVAATGQISADASVPAGTSSGRKPTTVVVKIPLTAGTQTIEAVWNGVRSTVVQTDTFSSLSAILTKNNARSKSRPPSRARFRWHLPPGSGAQPFSRPRGAPNAVRSNRVTRDTQPQSVQTQLIPAHIPETPAPFRPTPATRPPARDGRP